MKLFIDCRMLGSGGIGTYLENVLEFLVKENNCTLLCTSSQSSKLDIYKSSAFIIQTSIKTFSLKELFFFPSSLTKIINKCDAFYTPYCNVPCGIKVPVFTTIHDIVFLDIPGLASKTGIMIRKLFYQRAINKSKVIFTVSQFSADRIKEKLKLKNKKLVITYNSVPKWFLENAASQKSGQSKDNSIVFVGNIKKHKGLSVLLDAFELCKKNGIDVKLVIIGNEKNFRSGDDETAQRLQQTQDQNIIFTGKITDEQLCQYYKKAKLLVQPSLYEGFGMPPMEALSCGTNVVISDIPVFKEIYEGFPVTFFECSNSENLAEKITQAFILPDVDISKLPQKYSFEKTSQIIIQTIRGCL